MKKAAVFLIIVFLTCSLACLPKRFKKDKSDEKARADTEISETVTLEEETGKKPVGDGSWEPLGEETIDESRLEEDIKGEGESYGLENVYFEFDKYSLTSEAREKLFRNSVWLKEHPEVNIIIEGHCDSRGTEEYNLALGDKRAESVRAYLVSLGISSRRMQTISYGEELPVDPRETEEAWAKNRRCHFVVKK